MAFEAGLQRLAHRHAVHHAGRQALDGAERLGDDRPLAVGRVAQRVHHAADQRLAHRHGHDALGPLDRVAFLDLGVIAQQHRADLVFFQVQRQPGHFVGKVEELAGHGVLQAVNARHTVADRDDRPDLADRDAAVVVLNLLADDFGYFVSSNLCHHSCLGPQISGGPSNRCLELLLPQLTNPE